MKIALGLLFAYLLLFRGSSPKPWTKPGYGTRREHRAAYARKGFEI